MPSLLLAGCAGNPATIASAPTERCGSNECLLQRDIRAVEVIDGSYVVVYAGRQRCPFVVEIDPLSCDIGVAPDIRFLQRSLERLDRATAVTDGRICPTTRGLMLYAGIPIPDVLPQGAELPAAPVGIEPAGELETEMIGSEIAIDTESRDVCIINTIRAINDDQLLELYVERGIAPAPPPIGPGELEVRQPESAASVLPIGD